MAHKHPVKDVEGRAVDLVHAVNSALNAYYAKNPVPDNQRISVSLVTKGKGGKSRTPDEQAYYLLKKTSWTANSSHMSDSAKHILVMQNGKAVWSMTHLNKTQKDSFGVMVKAWNGAMKTEGLRTYAGKTTFDWKGSDPLHMELPHSRLKDTDPRVIKTLEIYAKATRLGGKAKNWQFENKKGSTFQKNWLKNYDLKLAGKGAKGP